MMPLLLLALVASADVLCVDDPMPTGPLAVSVYDGELGAPRHAGCPRSDVALGPAAYLVVDTPHFYGQLRGAAVVSGSYALDERTELFGSFEAVRYQAVISSVSSDTLGLGHLALGGSRALVEVMRSDVEAERVSTTAVAARLVLPTATGLYAHARPFALDFGIDANYVFAAGLEAFARLGAMASLAASKGPADPRVGLTLSSGGQWRATSWLSVAGELRGGFGYDAPLDLLAAGLGLRFAPVGRLGVALDGLVPLAGIERGITTLALRFSWLL